MYEIAGHPFWVFVLVGLAAGILSGTLGVGSGALLIPALVVFLLIPQKSAQGITLAVMIPLTIVGALRYKLNPEIEVNMNIVVALAIAGTVGALIGTELAARLPAALLRKLFAVFLLIVAIRMLLVHRQGERKRMVPKKERTTNHGQTSR